MRRILVAGGRWLRLRSARVANELARPTGGPLGRARRRILLLSSILALGTALLAFPGQVANGARGICRAPILQPGLSDLCGSAGLKGIADRRERRHWEGLDKGHCAALRAYLARYPGGAYEPRAQALLQRRRPEKARQAVAEQRLSRGYVRQGIMPFANSRHAVADAEGRAIQDAGDIGVCSPRPGEVLRELRLSASTPACSAVPGGTICGLEYTATCVILAHPVVERCD